MFDYSLEHLFSYVVSVEKPQMIGHLPEGIRAIFYVTKGEITGPKLRGRFLPGGGDWLTVRTDGVGILDVRATLERDDQGRRIKMRVSGRLGTRAAASRCEFRVDWGPVSEYALMLLYSPTSRWFSRFLSYGVAHGESRIGFFSATLPGPSGPASGADPKTSVDQHRLRERLWRSFRCQFVRWNS